MASEMTLSLGPEKKHFSEMEGKLTLLRLFLCFLGQNRLFYLKIIFNCHSHDKTIADWTLKY